MVTIGEFARLGQVTVKALRHYAALGLLTPAGIDPESGYRRYTEAQLPRLRRITELKTLGLRLEIIRSVLDDPPHPAQWRSLLQARQSDLLRAIRAEQAMLARVDRAVRELDDTVAPQAYAVALVELEPVLIAGIRDRIATGTIWTLFQEVRAWLAAHQASEAGPFLTLAHYGGSDQADTHDVEAAVVLNTPLPASERVQVRELPATFAARVMHYGAYDQLYRAHQALNTWIHTQGYERCAPGREIYWRDQRNAPGADAFITEIVVPVRPRVADEDGEPPLPVLRTWQFPELTIAIRAFAEDSPPLNLVPQYLPEGLIVTSLSSRLFGAADRAGRIVLVWSWNPPSVSDVTLLWDRRHDVPGEPERYPDGERMRYYLPGSDNQAATLILIDATGSVLFSSSVLDRETLLTIAASVPRLRESGV